VVERRHVYVCRRELRSCVRGERSKGANIQEINEQKGHEKVTMTKKSPEF